jgi:alpha-1,2-mannosyltransferase
VAGFLTFPGGDGWGYDFQAYADAAVRLEATGSLYQAETLEGPYRPGPYGLYMYAPPLGIAVTPLTALPLDTAITVWYLLHVVALVTACLLLPVPGWVRLAAFGVAALSFAATRDLVLGNVSVLLLLPLAAAWRWLDQPAGAVAQALAMSVRPMLGILLVWQLLRRQWRAVAWTLGSGLVLIVLTLPVVGIEGYREYLTVLVNLGGVTGVERNDDLSSTLLALGADEGLAELALLAGYGVAIAAIVLSLRRDAELGFVVTATASLLLSPLLWDHYLTMLVLPAAFLAARGRTWGLALPLLSWLPPVTLPFVVVAGVLLPFSAGGPRAQPTSPALDAEGLPA